jgi:hypothetical protein
MIRISGSQLDPKTLENQYPAGSFEQSLLQTMSGGDISYGSMDQLQFELELRKATVKAALELDRSNMDFAIFRKSRCNPDFWTRTEEGGFLLKDNVKSSAAVRDIYQNSADYATECATANVIVFLKAVLDVYPPALFDRSFSKIYLMNWRSVDPLLKGIGLLNDVSPFLPGDRMYFMNPDVDPKTPEWQGENVILLGTDRFYGPGIGIYNQADMIRMLNRHRTDRAEESAYLMNQAGRPDYAKLLSVRQDYHP